MKKRWIAMLLCMAMGLSALTGCSGGTDTTQAETAGEAGTQGASGSGDAASAGTAYRVLYSSEVETLNYLTSSSSVEQTVGANVIDTLIEYDNSGDMVPQPGMATEWSYDEASMTWTFKLREGMKWVDHTGTAVADVTAQDFVDALKYVLTPSYDSGTAYIVFDTILNASEYYDGQAGDADAIDFSEVGVKAVDELTLQYTLKKGAPYFLSLLTYVCFMPAYGPQLEEQGASFATSADTMYYCGAYYIETYEPQVQMVYKKNTSNWDAEHVYIETIQRTYNAEADTIGAEMAKRGEIDYTTLGSDVVDSWMQDPATSNMVSMERPSLDYSYFYCFNFNVKKLNEDCYRDGMEGYSMSDEYEPWNWELAVNNENFRQSLRHAINRISTIYVNTGDNIDPQNFMENTITPAGFAINTQNGQDYTEQPAFADIMANDSYNEELAKQYKETAMTELAAEGVTFPVKVLVRYNPSTTNWEEECIVLEQQLESVLGSDYIDVVVEAGPSTGFLGAVRRASDYMLMLCNWGADYADPETWTDPFYQAANGDGTYNRGSRYAYLAYAIEDNTASAETVKEYFALVEAAKAITDDLEARFAAFAEAEAYLIDHALAVPYGVSVSNFVVSKLNVWEGQSASCGVSNLRYKGQKVYENPISMEEYEAGLAAH